MRRIIIIPAAVLGLGGYGSHWPRSDKRNKKPRNLVAYGGKSVPPEAERRSGNGAENSQPIVARHTACKLKSATRCVAGPRA
jgi:hypothetical protein